MTLASNIFANAIGQLVSTALSFVFLPIYVDLLGYEAFGVIGCFAIFQTILSAFDFGLGASLNREAALFSSGNESSDFFAEISSTIERIGAVVVVTIFVFCVFVIGSSFKLLVSQEQLEKFDLYWTAIPLLASILLKFYENIFRAGLNGLGAQTRQSSITACFGILRSLLTWITLAYFSSTLVAFAIVQLVVSITSVSVMRAAYIHRVPATASVKKFNLRALKKRLGFTCSVASISLFSLLVTQTDKLLVSRMVSLHDFGVYVFLGALAAAINQLIAPILIAVYPRMVATSRKDRKEFLGLYSLISQLVCVAVGSSAMVMLVWMDKVLFVWTGDTGNNEEMSCLGRVLVFGNLMNCLAHLPHYCQLSFGKTRISLLVNGACAALFAPLLFVLVPFLGTLGAAWVWVFLNVMQFLLTAVLVHRQIIGGGFLKWFTVDIAIPLFFASIGVVVLMLLNPLKDQGRLIWFLFLGISAIVGSVIAMASSSLLRKTTLGFVRLLFVSKIAWRPQ